MINCFIAILITLLQAPDASTPKDAAKRLYDAVARGDEAALADHFYADDPAQRTLVAAYAHFVIQGKRLGDLAKQKFPGATDALTQGVIDDEDVARLDEATIRQNGDTATIQLPGKSRDMPFRRGADGRWRLVISDFAGSSGQNLGDQVALLNDFAKAFSDTADEIAADKLATPQDAETALQTRVNIVLTRAAKIIPPTSAPATTSATPSTQPK